MTPHSVFGHYGYVGEAQLDWFKKRLDEAERNGLLRIGLVHHNVVRGATDDDENLPRRSAAQGSHRREAQPPATRPHPQR